MKKIEEQGEKYYTSLPRQAKRKIDRGKISTIELRSMIKDASMLTTKYVVRAFSATVANTLIDKAELSRDEVVTILKEMHNLFDSITNGFVSITDIEVMLEEDYDIVFTEDGKVRRDED